MSESISEQDVEYSDILDGPDEEYQEEPELTEEPGFQIPKKFEGKGLEDVVKSYTELEKEFGRRNNEIGELRKLTDQLLGLQLAEKEQKTTKETVPQRPSVDFDSLVENPNEAIDNVVGSNPKLRALEEKLIMRERQEALQRFEQKHSDWKDLVATSEFQEWVRSTKGRQRMFVEADSNYDYELADELFTMYKETAGVGMQEEAEQKKATRNKALKDAASEKGTSGKKASKVYRRADLIKLMQTDREKYQQLLPEIERAYAEGRVR